MPTSGSTRQSHTPTTSSKMTPDVVVENADRIRGTDHYHSDRHHHGHGHSSSHSSHGNHGNHGTQSNHISSASNHVQPMHLSLDEGPGINNAANPNRSEIPPASRRKGSYDPVSLEHVHFISVCNHC